MQRPIENFVFHNNISSIGTGSVYSVTGGSSAMNVEFETSGTFSATFEAKSNINTTTWKPVTACNLATLDLNPTVTDKGYIYQVDLTGITVLRVNLTAVSGTISVYGKCIG